MMQHSILDDGDIDDLEMPTINDRSRPLIINGHEFEQVYRGNPTLTNAEADAEKEDEENCSINSH